MNLKSNLVGILILTMILSLISPSLGTDVQQYIDSFGPMNPKDFEKFSNRHSENILTVYGEVPAKSKGEESYEWWQALSNTIVSISNDQALGKYHYMNGRFITGYSPDRAGYIIIATDPEQRNKVTEQDLIEIKNIVDQYAEKNGINNTPIVILSEEYPKFSNNEPEEKNETNESETPNNSSNSIPSFTLTMCLLSIAFIIGISYKSKQKK
ncbi:hypothetical protein MsAg5_15450 [Methanosarcinaceae archaeon Ag5]|uniref:Uncharacterized protein n=1 Tax=Methanolapillus africanus TaxID=3028297 RepID=A0AAE4MKP8_9EURY|nr:hypothetical protein [Methanosarcinaceae archaeon Ag5]